MHVTRQYDPPICEALQHIIVTPCAHGQVSQDGTIMTLTENVNDHLGNKISCDSLMLEIFISVQISLVL